MPRWKGPITISTMAEAATRFIGAWCLQLSIPESSFSFLLEDCPAASQRLCRQILTKRLHIRISKLTGNKLSRNQPFIPSRRNQSMRVHGTVAGVNLHLRLSLMNIEIAKFSGATKRAVVIADNALIALPGEKLTADG